LTTTMRRTAISGLALIGTATLLLAGCAAAPEEGGNTTTPSNTPAANDYLPCMVSDSGGFNDHSFNELGKKGLDDGAADLGVTAKAVQSKDDNDYDNNIQSLLAQNCDLIVTVGFNLADATKKYATDNPDTDFAIIDDNSIDLPNVQPIVFDTAQAAFLAGYAAASYTKTGVVGTFGGMQYPTVTIFMDGFYDGVQYYNQQKSKSVKVVGWDVNNQKGGSFTGGFEANQTAKNTAQGLIDQNADVIMPVGGPIYQSAAEAIRDSKKDIALIGVDADVYLTDPSVKDLLLTSVMKGIAPSTEAVVKAAGEGKFDNTPYVGTLENDGVGIAPFHDYESKVDPGLKGELDAIKADIISGKIEVQSPSSPK